MSDMYEDSLYAYVAVIIVLGVLVLGLGVALLIVSRKKKVQPQYYSETVIHRIDGQLGGGAEDAGVTGQGRETDGLKAVEKANPVAPYTSWDREDSEERRTEASFGGFVQDEDPVPDNPLVKEAASGNPSEGADEGILVREAGHGLVSGLEPEQALLLFKSHELLLTLSDGFKKLVSAKTDEARKEKLAEMQEAMKLLDAKNEWEQYRACFNQLYPGFWSKVEASAGEEMSPYELRLCALLSLGMGTKELADLTNRSVRTVETSIYKIRKKLGMGSEEKTSDFLRRFL